MVATHLIEFSGLEPPVDQSNGSLHVRACPQASVTSRLSPGAGQSRPSGDLELRCITDKLLAGCVLTEVVVTKRKVRLSKLAVWVCTNFSVNVLGAQRKRTIAVNCATVQV